MAIRIGLDDTGGEVGIATGARTRVALLGPAGCGKTTTCRYLLRSWLATTGGTGVLVTSRPYEYGDLDVVIADPSPQRPTLEGQPSVLVVDDIDDAGPLTLERAIRSQHQLVIVTSRGSATTMLTLGGLAFDRAYFLQRSPRLAAVPMQGRLDWSAETIPVFLDRRGYRDFPPHKWAM